MYPPRHIRPALALVSAALFLAGCRTPTQVPEDFVAQAAELERDTLEEMVVRYPDAEAELERAVAYAIFSNHATKVPLVGRGEGFGVAVDRRDGVRQFLRVTHFDVGGGLGDLSYRLVILFFDYSDYERLRNGTLHVGGSIDTAGGSETAGFGGSGRGTSRNKNRTVYLFSDSGAAATWTIRLVRFTPLDQG